MKYTTEGLALAGMSLVPPFRVDVQFDPDEELLESVRPVEFKEVLRVLPGRRVSGLVEIDGRICFAKVFYGPRARRYWRRELVGAAALAESGIACARVLRRGATAEGTGFIVVYEALPDVAPIADDDSALMGATVDLVAEMHEQGLVQADVHLGNFVSSNGRMFVVDADSVRRARLLRVQFGNLGMLLAQRRSCFDSEIAGLWERYAARRGDYVARMGSAQAMAKLVPRQRARRVRRYLKKTLRECTEFHHRRTLRENILCDRRCWRDLQRLCLFPETVFDEGTAVKLGNSSTVVRVTIEAERYVVKRYNVKGLGHRVKRWFKRRARRAWVNGHRLAFLGVSTARPVALIEKRFGWFTDVCYLVMPDCGERTLDQVLDAEPHTFEALAPQIVGVLRLLAAANVRHGDLKATNFIVEDGRVYLIDFDGVTAGDGRDDVARFLANWEGSEELLARWQRVLVDGGVGLQARA